MQAATAVTPAPRAVSTRRTTATGQGARGIVTDYGYVIGELRRIGIVTVGITALLLVLWLIIG